MAVPDPRLARCGFAKLVGTRDDNEGLEFFVRKYEVLMGRNSKSSDVDVILGSNMNISRRHAKITYNFDGKHFEIVALGKNGLTVGCDTILPESAPRPLASGDCITVGGSRVFFMLPQDTNASAATAAALGIAPLVGAAARSPEEVATGGESHRTPGEDGVDVARGGDGSVIRMDYSGRGGAGGTSPLSYQHAPASAHGPGPRAPQDASAVAPAPFHAHSAAGAAADAATAAPAISTADLLATLVRPPQLPQLTPELAAQLGLLAQLAPGGAGGNVRAGEGPARGGQLAPGLHVGASGHAAAAPQAGPRTGVDWQVREPAAALPGPHPVAGDVEGLLGGQGPTRQ